MRKRKKFIIPAVIAIALVIGGIFLFTSLSPTPTPLNGSENSNNSTPNGNSSPPTVTHPAFGEGDNLQVGPSEVEIKGYYSGYEASHTLEIYNGSDTTTEFSIYYQVHERRRVGFSAPPQGAENWITIEDPSPTLLSKEIRSILITLHIPEGTVVDAQDWEFRIVVRENTGASIEVEIGTRWLVRMQ